MEPRSHPGSCHCGAVRYAFTTALAPQDWSIRACQCSFCAGRGALSVSDPAGRLDFTAAEDHLTRGVYAIANTRTLDPMPDGIADAVPMDYDAEDTDACIDRRERVWTPATLKS